MGVISEIGLAALLLSLWLISSQAFAADRTFDLWENVTPIVDSGGETRLLIDLSFLQALECEDILDARIALQLPRGSEGLVIEVHPLTRTWSPGSVTWSVPWDSAGGDFAKGRVQRVRVSGEACLRGRIHFPLTDMLLHQIEDRCGSCGLILVPGGRSATGFASEWIGSTQAQGRIVLTLVCE